MKLKKIIIGLFATIGVLSVLACLVGIGYLAGSSTSIPEWLNFAKPATGSPEVSTENTETLNENATGNTDLGTLISADRGSSQGNVVSNITPTPGVNQGSTGGPQGSTDTPTQTPSNPNPTYIGFEPGNITVNEDNTLSISDELIESMRDLPQFQEYSDNELKNFIDKIYDNEIAGVEDSSEVFNAISRYNDKDLLDYMTGHYLTERPATPTPMPTETPKQEDLTFTSMDNSISWFPLTAINVWSEATDFGKKVGTLEGKGCLVVVDSVCNETGYYHVLYAGPTDTDFSEGYIHPDHFQYLTTAEEEYEKKVEAGLINPDEIPSNTPSTEAPTPAPTAKPTETPSESEQAKPTETPAKPTAKPTATPTPKPSTPSATDYDSYKIKYKYFKDYITGYTDEGYPILPDGNILTPTTTPETLGYNPATIDGYTEEGYVIIGGFPCIPTDTIHGDSQDGGEYGGGTFEGGIH